MWLNYDSSGKLFLCLYLGVACETMETVMRISLL